MKGGDEEAGEAQSVDSLINTLIRQSRKAVELGISTADWQDDDIDSVPEGFNSALSSGIDFVDVFAGSHAEELLAEGIDKASQEEEPRFCLRLEPKKLFGLGLILNKDVVKSISIFKPLEASLKHLKVDNVELLVLHSDSTGKMSFSPWILDAVASACNKGLCNRIGISHPGATGKSISEAAEALQDRGVALSCVFLRLSLMEQKSLDLAQECQRLGLQVFACDPLGPDELASGRYTVSNPTGGEIAVPRFTLQQLMPLRPLHEALEKVAALARQRCEKSVDTTTVALQWVRSKGASPLCDVVARVNAQALAACREWELDASEVEMLDEVAAQVGKGRRR